MEEEFKRHLKQITEDDPDFLYPHWISSAEYFCDLSKLGIDITLATQGLEDVFLESHQLPVMRPAAEALVRTYLKNSPEKLGALFKKRDTAMWLIEALAEVGKNTDIEPATQYLIEYSSVSEYTAIDSLLSIAMRNKNVYHIAKKIFDMGNSRMLEKYLDGAKEKGLDISQTKPLDKRLNPVTTPLILPNTYDPTSDLRICSICRNLPRNGSWNNEYQIPKQKKKLIDKDGLSVCPECENYYRFSYSAEYEDNHTIESFSLDRLSPIEIRNFLSGEKKVAYENGLIELEKKMELDLQHESPWQRSEGAWKLSAILIDNQRYSKLISLLKHKEEEVRFETLVCILFAVKNGFELNPLQEQVESTLSDFSDRNREQGAGIIALIGIKEKNYKKLEKLLSSEDPEVVYGSLVQIYFALVSGQITPVLPELILKLTIHPLRKIRNFSRYFREAALEKGEILLSNEEALILRLEDKDLEIRSESLEELAKLLPRFDPSSVLSKVVSLLDTDSSYFAFLFLQKCAKSNKSLNSIFPALFQKYNTQNRAEMISLFLSCITNNEIDSKMLSIAIEGLRDSKNLWQATALIQALAEKNIDLSEYISSIEDFITESSGADSYTESMLNVLILHYFKKGQFNSIKKILINRTRAHKISALYILNAMELENLIPLKETFKICLDDPSTKVRELSQQILKKIF